VSNYAFMPLAKYDEISGQLTLGVRFSVDGQQVVAKLADGQQVEGVTVESHEQAIATIQGPDWTPSAPE